MLSFECIKNEKSVYFLLTSALTPINGRIVGCHGKPCDYMSNLFLGIAKVLQKSAKKLLTIVI